MTLYMIGDSVNRFAHVVKLNRRGYKILNTVPRRDFNSDYDLNEDYNNQKVFIDKSDLVFVENDETEISKLLIDYAIRLGKDFVIL